MSGVPAESSTADWTHRKAPSGRNFSVEKKDTYGLGLRGGYQLRSGTLLYARADRVRTRFKTTWVKGGNRDNDVDRHDRSVGRRRRIDRLAFRGGDPGRRRPVRAEQADAIIAAIAGLERMNDISALARLTVADAP